MATFREEVVNVQLAEALISLGFEAYPETVTRNRQLPDVILNLGGLKLVIEGRVEKSRASLLRHAAKRVTDGLADISLAILYPNALAHAPSLPALRDRLAAATYAGAIFSFSEGGLRREVFSRATLNNLVELINGAFRLVVQNDIVREHVHRVEGMIERIVEETINADLFFRSEVLAARLRGALGIESGGDDEEELD